MDELLFYFQYGNWLSLATISPIVAATTSFIKYFLWEEKDNAGDIAIS